MYKWISIVAIGSNLFSNNNNNNNNNFTEINIRLLENSNFDIKPLYEMTSVSPLNVISYDYDWMPNMLYNDVFDTHTSVCHSINQLDTHTDADFLAPNEKLDINQINNELNQYYLLTNEMPIIETMNEVDYENCDDGNEWKWKDKLKKHRKSSNFGFSSLQKRIERVKNDIINLTNKLNSGGYVNDNDEINPTDVSTYYNLGFGNLMENELPLSDEEPKMESNDTNREEKTWKCPSQFNTNNPFSELSENTQKILNRLHLNDEPVQNNQCVQEEEIETGTDDDFEMEEDDIEFTFCTNQNGLLQSYLSKGTLPIIEEEEEIYSSSDDDTDSVRSTIIENLIIDTETIDTPKSTSLQSIDFTESESYITALTNPAIPNQCSTDKTSSSFEDAEENLSDYARYSISSQESLNSYKIDKLDNETNTEKTLINNESNQEFSYIVETIKEFSSSSIRMDETSDSDAEYDHSSWSNEEILQSTEHSDSMYEKPMKSLIKSSLPDLIESTDCSDLNERNYFYTNRNLNKSTDLDEIMLKQKSPHSQSTMHRLSMSLSNLSSNRSENIISPQRFFQDTASHSNLLETDLDSGFVSIYQPIRETEILPNVDFSFSMININQDKSPVAFNSLVEKLKSKAGSIPELRIANSLKKLNVPDWLNYRQEELTETTRNDRDIYKSLPNKNHIPPSTAVLLSPTKITSLPRLTKPAIIEPTIKPQLFKPVILPSQKLRQSSTRRLTPIKSCSAREYMQPNRVSTGIL